MTVTLITKKIERMQHDCRKNVGHISLLFVASP